MNIKTLYNFFNLIKLYHNQNTRNEFVDFDFSNEGSKCCRYFINNICNSKLIQRVFLLSVESLVKAFSEILYSLTNS